VLTVNNRAHRLLIGLFWRCPLLQNYLSALLLLLIALQSLRLPLYNDLLISTGQVLLDPRGASEKVVLLKLPMEDASRLLVPSVLRDKGILRLEVMLHVHWY
jgi:hypothetical protein